MKEQIAEIFPVLNEQAKKIVGKGESIETDNEISEACLFAIESLVRKSPKGVEAFIEKILALA